MIRSRRVVLVVLAALGALLGTAGSAQAARDRGDVKVIFEQVQPANRDAVAIVRRAGSGPRVARVINTRYALPRNLPIYISDDAPAQLLDNGPAYYPGLRAILIPGGFVTLLRNAMGSLAADIPGLSGDAATAKAIEFIALHEVGHAFVHQFRLPVTGREEDAVDGFAAFTTVGSPSFGTASAFSAALFFAALAASRGELAPDYADVHSTPEQRAYQFLCWIYGSSPRRFGALVGGDGLPRDRAAGCPAEWRQNRYAWATLLKPFRKR